MKYRNLGPRQKELVDALMVLEDQDEVASFLRDLLTDSEMEEISARWKAARMLEKDAPYAEITEETGLSSTTVARVSKWMKQGAGGYRLVLDRLKGSRKL